MKFNIRDYLWLPSSTNEPIPVPDSTIQEAENILGVKLPQSYLNIMRNRIGNRLRFDTFPSPSDYAGSKYPFIHRFRAIIELSQSKWLCDEWQMPQNLVLLAGDGHTWIALDYRNKP